jgi:hypothetical protein
MKKFKWKQWKLIQFKHEIKRANWFDKTRVIEGGSCGARRVRALGWTRWEWNAERKRGANWTVEEEHEADIKPNDADKGNKNPSQTNLLGKVRTNIVNKADEQR